MKQLVSGCGCHIQMNFGHVTNRLHGNISPVAELAKDVVNLTQQIYGCGSALPYTLTQMGNEVAHLT